MGVAVTCGGRITANALFDGVTPESPASREIMRNPSAAFLTLLNDIYIAGYVGFMWFCYMISGRSAMGCSGCESWPTPIPSTGLFSTRTRPRSLARAGKSSSP